MQALAAGRPHAIQNSYSLLERQDEQELLLCARSARRVPCVQSAGRGMADREVPPRAAVSGRLADDAAPGPYEQFLAGPTFDALDRLGTMATRRGTSMAGLALAWLLADHRVTQIVIGPARPEHLKPVGEALECPVTADEKAEIERAFM